MAISAEPDQLASAEANWSGSALFAKGLYQGSAGLGLIFFLDLHKHLYAVGTHVHFTTH